MSVKMSLTRALLKLNKELTIKKINNKKEKLPFLTVTDVIELDERNVGDVVKKIALIGVDVTTKQYGGLNCSYLSKKKGSKYFKSTPSRDDYIFVYIHGGGFCNGFALQGAFLMKAIMRRIGCASISPEYSLSPEKRYPTALNELYEMYLDIINDYKPNKIIIGGESAGANLCMALLMKLRDNNKPMPLCALLSAGYFDLANSGKSYVSNEERDVSLTNLQTPYMSQAYLCGDKPSKDYKKYLTDPYVSPLYGDFKNLIPMFFSVCSDELLFDDTLIVYDKAKQYNKCFLHISKKCFHGYMATGDFFKESKRVNNLPRHFIQDVLKNQIKIV